MSEFLGLDNENATEEEREEERLTIRENEDDMLSGLLEAAAYTEHETRKIEIVREGKTYFSFSIHPIDEEMLNEIRKKYTKYAKNKRQGTRVAEELDTPKYRASVIYNSTIDADKRRIWDNQKLWKGLQAQGRTIINALDVIEAVLLPGEKDWLMDVIDDINGYNNEELKMKVAKN